MNKEKYEEQAACLKAALEKYESRVKVSVCI
jgi:hypothetical protein